MVLMNIARLKGYLFDLDGTLLASTRFWHEAYGKALARFGVEMPADYVEHVNHLNIASGTAYTAERFGIEGGAASVERVWRELAGDAYAEEIELTPHAKELLYALKNADKHLGIATALDLELAQACLERHGVWGIFETFVTVGDVGKDKSSPAVYLSAAERLGLSPCECAVFEDGETGARSARSAGFFVAGVADPYSGSDPARMRAVCDRYEKDLGGYLADFAPSVRR